MTVFKYVRIMIKLCEKSNLVLIYSKIQFKIITDSKCYTKIRN